MPTQPWPMGTADTSSSFQTPSAATFSTPSSTFVSSSGDPFAVANSPVLIVTVVVTVVVGVLLLVLVAWLCRSRQLRLLRREARRETPARPRKKKRVLGQKPVMDSVWIANVQVEKIPWKSILPISASFMPSTSLTSGKVADPPPPSPPDAKPPDTTPQIPTPDPLLQVSVLIAMPSPEPSQFGRKSLSPDVPKDPDADSEWETDPSIPELVLGVTDIEIGWVPEPNMDPNMGPVVGDRAP